MTKGQTYILNVGNEQVAVFGPADCGGVDVLHHEPEQILVPLKNEVPKVSFEEVLCSVEEGA